MKVYVYYLKSNNTLFAMTKYDQLAEEFELTYDMDKFIVKEISMEKVEYMDSSLNKYKLWDYTCIVKDLETVIICMTKEMRDNIHKASDNILYTFKSVQITTERYKLDGYNISEDFSKAIFDMAYSTDITGDNSLDDNNIFTISTYKIWTDIYSDIIKIISKEELSNDRSVDALRLLGIYKYDNNHTS